MPDNDLLLELKDVRKSFAGVKVLHGIDFQLWKGEIHALLGQNGAGKSTLMKLLNGVHHMDEGEILIRGRSEKPRSPKEAQALGIGMVFQEFSLVSSLTVEENLLLLREPTRAGVIRSRVSRARAQEALAALGASIDSQVSVGQLPVGDQQLVEIAKTLLQDPAILILDEPTASLSHAEIERLFGVLRGLRSRGIGIIYISHHLEEVLDLCDRATIIRDGRVTLTTRVADVNMGQLVEAVVGKALEAEVARESTLAVDAEQLLGVDDLVVGNRVRGVSFTVNRGEVVGVAGLVGSGRSEMLEALFGLRRCTGTINWKGRSISVKSPRHAMRLGMALIPEDRRLEGLVAQHSVADNMLLAAWSRVTRAGLILNRQASEIVRSFIERLEIRVAGVQRPVATLSGGNQQKVVLAKFLAIRPDLMMLDEPTAGIDVGTKRQIINQMRILAGEGCSGIFVSSDLEEVALVSDRILVLRRGVLTAEIDCRDRRPTEGELLAAIQSEAA